MKKFSETESITTPKVRIDSSLDKRYEKIKLSPEKLKRANEDLLKSNFTDFIEENKNPLSAK